MVFFHPKKGGWQDEFMNYQLRVTKSNKPDAQRERSSLSKKVTTHPQYRTPNRQSPGNANYEKNPDNNSPLVKV